MDIQAVIEAIMALSIICVTLFIVVWNCKDFVGFHRAVFKGMIISIFVHLGLVVVFIAMGGFHRKDQGFGILFSVCMIVIGCFYLCFDLLLIIMPGFVDPEDYILAAMMLYLDVA